MLETCEEVVRQEVGRMLRFGLPTDRDDLTQTGREAALKAASRYQPARGVPLSAYVRLIVRRHLRAQVAADLAVVHVSARRQWDARNYQERVGVEQADGLDPAPSAEELALVTEREQALEAWRRKVREELRVAAADLPAAQQAAAWAVLLGQRRPREVAARRKVPVRDVYRATARVRGRLMRSPSLARLWSIRADL